MTGMKYGPGASYAPPRPEKSDFDRLLEGTLSTTKSGGDEPPEVPGKREHMEMVTRSASRISRAYMASRFVSDPPETIVMLVPQEVYTYSEMREMEDRVSRAGRYGSRPVFQMRLSCRQEARGG